MANWFWRRKRMGIPDYNSEEFNLDPTGKWKGAQVVEKQQSYNDWKKLQEWVGDKQVSDGSTASYYELPKVCSELQDLISAKNMNAQIGEIFRECYRYGQASHSDELRGIKKILFYANAELKRLQNVDS
jgi:hypothetical protein